MSVSKNILILTDISALYAFHTYAIYVYRLIYINTYITQVSKSSLLIT